MKFLNGWDINVDYFHKKFKKYTGMSPAEFRKKQGA